MKIKEDQELLSTILEGIKNRKGQNITVIDLTATQNIICNYFVICTATSNTHAVGVADEVEKHTNKMFNIKPYHKEGVNNAQWILLDYIDIIVHVFQKETREYYRLEDLWADAKIKNIKTNTTVEVK